MGTPGSANSTRLSLDIVDLPLMPFGMSPHSRLRKTPSTQDSRMNKLSLKAKRTSPGAQDTRNKENQDHQHLTSHTPPLSSISRSSSSRDHNLPTIEEDHDSLECEQESEGPTLRGPRAKGNRVLAPTSAPHTGQSHRVRRCSPPPPTSAPHTGQSHRVRRCSPPPPTSAPHTDQGHRRDSLWTDIDDGSFIEFCQGTEGGQDVVAAVNEPTSTICQALPQPHYPSQAPPHPPYHSPALPQLYYTCDSHQDVTKYSTSTKVKDAEVGFRQFVEAVRKQKSLQHLREKKNNGAIDYYRDETIITCSADLRERKAQHRATQEALSSTVVGGPVQRFTLPDSEFSRLTMAPTHVSDSDSAEPSPTPSPGCPRQIFPPFTAQYVVVESSDDSDQEEVVQVRVEREGRNKDQGVAGGGGSVISEDVSIVYSLPPVNYNPNIGTKKQTETGLSTLPREGQVRIDTGHVPRPLDLDPDPPQPHTEILHTDVSPAVAQWIITSPFKDNPFGTSFLDEKEDTFISETPSQPKNMRGTITTGQEQHPAPLKHSADIANHPQVGPIVEDSDPDDRRGIQPFACPRRQSEGSPTTAAPQCEIVSSSDESESENLKHLQHKLKGTCIMSSSEESEEEKEGSAPCTRNRSSSHTKHKSTQQQRRRAKTTRVLRISSSDSDEGSEGNSHGQGSLYSDISLPDIDLERARSKGGSTGTPHSRQATQGKDHSISTGSTQNQSQLEPGAVCKSDWRDAETEVLLSQKGTATLKGRKVETIQRLGQNFPGPKSKKGQGSGQGSRDERYAQFIADTTSSSDQEEEERNKERKKEENGYSGGNGDSKEAEDSFEEYLKRVKSQLPKKPALTYEKRKNLDEYDSSFINDDSEEDNDSYHIPPLVFPRQFTRGTTQGDSRNLGSVSEDLRLKHNSKKSDDLCVNNDERPPSHRQTPRVMTVTLSSSSSEDSDAEVFVPRVSKKPSPSFTPINKPVGRKVPQTEKGSQHTIRRVVGTGMGTPTLSFLGSLSSNTRGIRCHPEALPYTRDFKKKKEELVEKLYKLYNYQVFGKQLPTTMQVTWNVRLRKTAGYCYYQLDKSQPKGRSARIELSVKVIDCAERLRDTLIHELCHAAAWIISGYKDGHGPLWKAWAAKARHTFPDLPAINRCHAYDIKCKYTYKCSKCGYSIGRHSKSLDTIKKVCGYCHGKFEVFLTSQLDSGGGSGSKGSSLATPRTPKTPGPFAQFVKENYGSVKKAQGAMTHADVMKALGAQFSQLKASGK